MERLGLKLGGMSGADCAAKVAAIITDVPGVIKSNVNFDLEQATIDYNRQQTNPAEIVQAVRTAGYQAISLAEPLIQSIEPMVPLPERVEAEDIDLKLLVAIVCTLLVVFGMLPGILDREISWIPDWLSDPLGQLILTTPVQLWCGQSVLIGAWNAARQLRFGLNMLIVLSTGTAYLYSLFGTFAPQAIGIPQNSHPHLYYQISAVGITLLLVGIQVEQNAIGKTVSSIAKLAQLQPQVARILEGGAEITRPAEQVQLNQVVAVHPGEYIPVEGTIIAGESMVDESMVTGKSQPVIKQIGDDAIGATLNYTGSLNIEVSRVGTDTLLAQMMKLVAQAQVTKAPIYRFTERVARSFVPIAILIVSSTSLAWLILAGDRSMALITGVSVSILAYPCAVGLATPTAIMVGTAKGAEQGILIKNGASLELLDRVKTIVFDKTGTLTIGQLVVTDFIPVVDTYHGDELSILQLAASVEYPSAHPLANAIVDYATSKNLSVMPVTEFQAIVGSGVEGVVDGKLVQVGSSEWIATLVINGVMQIANQQILTSYERQWETEGKTVVWLAIDGEIAGIIGITDEIKPRAIETITRLKQLGLEVILLTGDNWANAQRLARRVGIDRVFAQVQPQGKAELIQSLQATMVGKHRSIVAMVGDGLNDAPALAQADVGIAMGEGHEIAISASDITIVSPSLQAIITAIELSRATLTNVHQNLLLAFIFNLISIPIAAGLFYPVWGWLLTPLLATGAMGLSSLLVVANALRLNKFRPTSRS